MKKHSAIGIIAISCIFSINTLSQELVICPDNDLQCINRHLDSVKSIEIKKTEKDGSILIESTKIKLTNSDNYTYTEFPDMQSMPGFKIEKREKSVRATADISIDYLKAIKEQPNNSIFKTIIQTCPNLSLSENIKKLNGAKAQCTLNEAITVTYVPEDIYWCDEHSSCMHGPFPRKMDERLQLPSNGLTAYYKCQGSLIDYIKSICIMNDRNVSEKGSHH